MQNTMQKRRMKRLQLLQLLLNRYQQSGPLANGYLFHVIRSTSQTDPFALVQFAMTTFRSSFALLTSFLRKIEYVAFVKRSTRLCLYCLTKTLLSIGRHYRQTHRRCQATFDIRHWSAKHSRCYTDIQTTDMVFEKVGPVIGQDSLWDVPRSLGAFTFLTSYAWLMTPS